MRNDQESSRRQRSIPRIGLLLPSTNSVMEPDLWNSLWPQASFHTFRLRLDDVTPAAETRMLAAAPEAADQLRSLAPVLTIFGCTSAGGLLGRTGERALVADLAVRGGLEVMSVLDAATQALREVNGSSVAVFTPYIPALSDAVAASLGEEGFEVERVTSLGLTDNGAIGALDPATIVEVVAERLEDTAADAVFISCTNLRAMEAADELSRRLGLPVVTSNSAVAHVARQRLGREPAALEN